MRRIGCVLSLAMFAWIVGSSGKAVPSGHAMQPQPACTDVNCDGLVDVVDALVLLRSAVGLPLPQRACPCDVPTTTTTTTLDACARPLDEYSVSRLAFDLGDAFEVEPGATQAFELGVFECCYYLEPVDVCATYSVSPPLDGVRIDATTGVLEVGCRVPDGSSFEVVADVENGRKRVTAQVYVIEPDLHPLRGYHWEVGQLACDGGDERVPAQPIQELVFYSYGWFEVTWSPFEVYVDYWGTYEFDRDTGSLSMSITGGNYVPWDFDGIGHVTFEGSDVVLHDIWLGSPSPGYGSRACGHRFR